MTRPDDTFPPWPLPDQFGMSISVEHVPNCGPVYQMWFGIPDENAQAKVVSIWTEEARAALGVLHYFGYTHIQYLGGEEPEPVHATLDEYGRFDFKKGRTTMAFTTDPGQVIKWDGPGADTDWRAHISAAQRAEWPNFSPENRMLLANLASDTAEHAAAESAEVAKDEEDIARRTGKGDPEPA